MINYILPLVLGVRFILFEFVAGLTQLATETSHQFSYMRKNRIMVIVNALYHIWPDGFYLQIVATGITPTNEEARVQPTHTLKLDLKNVCNGQNVLFHSIH